MTDMGSIFYRDRVFHQPINDWNVASVANMDEMFVGASDFNQPLDDVLSMQLILINHWMIGMRQV